MVLLKNAEPIMLAEYAKSMKISREPAFLWWVPYTLHERSQLHSEVKAFLLMILSNISKICSINSYHIGLYIYIYIYESYHPEYKEYLLF